MTVKNTQYRYIVTSWAGGIVGRAATHEAGEALVVEARQRGLTAVRLVDVHARAGRGRDALRSILDAERGAQ